MSSTLLPPHANSIVIGPAVIKHTQSPPHAHSFVIGPAVIKHTVQESETHRKTQTYLSSGEEQKKENIKDGLYSNFIVSVSWTQGEDKTKENMLPETATFDDSLSSTVVS